MPPDAARRRVRRSRVGFTTARVRTVVYVIVSLHVPTTYFKEFNKDAAEGTEDAGLDWNEDLAGG